MTNSKQKRRYTSTPSKKEVSIRAIRLLSPNGWRLYRLNESPTIGTVPKHFLSFGDPDNPDSYSYFAKKGRTSNDARECVTEEIISKIGAMLPIDIAESKLARISKYDVRFLSRNFVSKGRNQLVHGFELAARYFDTDPEDLQNIFDLGNKKDETNFYSIDKVLTILEFLFPDNFDEIKKNFFKMIAFDAFIGEHDRHAMNWGVLVPIKSDTCQVQFAPIFDTARGLFREISDVDLYKKEKTSGRNQFLDNYAMRSKPILGAGQDDGNNHFSLIKWITNNTDQQGNEALNSVFNSVDLDDIKHMLQLNFRRIITQYRMNLITELLSVRITKIKEELK